MNLEFFVLHMMISMATGKGQNYLAKHISQKRQLEDRICGSPASDVKEKENERETDKKQPTGKRKKNGALQYQS